MIPIHDLDKAQVLVALYNFSRPNGLGYALKTSEARKLLIMTTRFDRVRGRILPVDLSGDTFDPTAYDRAYWSGAGGEAILKLRRQASAFTLVRDNVCRLCGQDWTRHGHSAQQVCLREARRRRDAGIGDGIVEGHVETPDPSFLLVGENGGVCCTLCGATNGPDGRRAFALMHAFAHSRIVLHDSGYRPPRLRPAVAPASAPRMRSHEAA